MRRMTILLVAMCLLILLPVLASAHTTLSWDRNTETNMKEYHVYSCPGPEATPCTPVISATPEAIVAHPTTGTGRINYLPGSGKEAWYGVTAVDTASNESVLSQVLFFDSKPPAAPANVQRQ